MELELRPYQEEAVDRILERKQVLVAYQMGLGKTPLTVRAMEQMMEAGEIQHTVLIVVLSSLKYQWQDEIARWAPESTSLVITGSPAKRMELYDDMSLYDYVIVNYELVVRDFAVFNQRTWGAVVCDEVTAIKGFRSKRSKAIKKLASRVPIRVGLTGTPISNGKPEEIYSLMQFVDPDVLGQRFDLFDRTFIVRNPFGGVSRYRNLDVLHDRLASAVVRKRQADPDVAPYLPTVQDIPPDFVKFDRAGQALYDTIASDLLSVLDDAAAVFGGGWNFNVAAHYGQGNGTFDPAQAAMTGEIMTRIQALRMLCSHPEAVKASARKYGVRFESESGDPGPGPGSAYAYLLEQRGLLDKKLGSPKADAVVARVKDFLDLDPENKIVLFSFFVDVLPILAQQLSEYGPRLFQGGMSDQAKHNAKTSFQKDPSSRILLSSDAGGYGVDLPEANLLINYDLPWSASDALQRNSRIIRASSEWPSVRIERFLMDGSLEIRQWQALAHKTAVSEAIVDGGRVTDKGDVFTTVDSLRDVLTGGLPA